MLLYNYFNCLKLFTMLINIFVLHRVYEGLRLVLTQSSITVIQYYRSSLMLNNTVKSRKNVIHIRYFNFMKLQEIQTKIHTYNLHLQVP